MTNARKQLCLDAPIVGTVIDLVPVKGEHLAHFVSFFQDERVMYYYLPTPLKCYSLSDLQVLIKDWDNGDTDVLLTIEKDGRPIGLMNVDNVDLGNRNAEIGIALTVPELRGHGLAKNAITLLMSHVLQAERLHRLYARVVVGNTASRLLFESAGFRYEGTLKEALMRPEAYLDMDVFGKVGF